VGLAMSNENKEQESIENDVNVSVDKSKRKFSKAGLAAPVIMTLASKPVFALQGLSNMLSTHGSATCGRQRRGGMSPGFWKTPSGSTDINLFTDIPEKWDSAWDRATGMTNAYGTPNTDTAGNPVCEVGGTGNSRCNKWDDFSGGYSDSRFGSSEPLRVLLNENPGTPLFHYIAGFLNASYYQAHAIANGGTAKDTEYFITVQEFWDLLDKTLDPFSDLNFPYDDLVDMISFNYHVVPEGEGPYGSSPIEVCIPAND